jgi:hypothetical protein
MQLHKISKNWWRLLWIPQLLFIAWVVLVPAIWTCFRAGQVGHTGHDSDMRVWCVLPWPDRNLWTFHGEWQPQVVKIKWNDGTEELTMVQGFAGFCYVSEMHFE